MILIRVLFVVFLLLSMTVHSLNNKTEVFVDGCVSLIKIYSDRDEKSKLSAVFTSVADSYRAGYCRGILEAYSGSCYKDWYDMAKYVAAQKPFINQYYSIDRVVKEACGS